MGKRDEPVKAKLKTTVNLVFLGGKNDRAQGRGGTRERHTVRIVGIGWYHVCRDVEI